MNDNDSGGGAVATAYGIYDTVVAEYSIFVVVDVIFVYRRRLEKRVISQ